MDCSPPGSSVMGFSRQGYWSGWSCPPSGDLPNPGTEPRSLALQADSLPRSHQGSPIYMYMYVYMYMYIFISLPSANRDRNTINRQPYCRSIHSLICGPILYVIICDIFGINHMRRKPLQSYFVKIYMLRLKE